MSRTQASPSSIVTDSAVGFVANIFRGTACIQEAFRQESGELQYLENCWSDSEVLKFIFLGWIGLTLKFLLLVLLGTFICACVQGRRPSHVFVSFLKGTRRVVGNLFSCFELEDEARERRAAAEAESGLRTIWRDEKKAGGYFGSPKQKVLSPISKRDSDQCANFEKRCD